MLTRYFQIIFLIIALISRTYAQKQWTYDFNNGLSPIEQGGPQLKKLGDAGQFVKEKLPGSEDISRTVYQFAANSGLQFNNTEAGGFLNKSFTVEIFFKMSTLDTWKRVLDFKNRKSDFGCYIYDGKLNFFNLAVSENAPVKVDRYVHFVYSRDFDTKIIKMYINGLSKVEFSDLGNEGILDVDQVLNIFQDDLIAGHEASAGSVALIRLYDRVMTPVFIRRSYRTLIKAPEKEEEVAADIPVNQPVEEKAPPKTGKNTVTVTGRVYDSRNLNPVDNVDIRVVKAKDQSLVTETKTSQGIYSLELAPYQNYKITATVNGFQSKSISVNTNSKYEDIKSLISLSEQTYSLPVVTIFFPQSTETLDGASKSKLDSAVSYFQNNPGFKILVKGHTDNVGNFDKNLALSNARALETKKYLLEKGIEPSRITENGVGSSQPESTIATEEQRRNNRRVEIYAVPVKR